MPTAHFSPAMFKFLAQLGAHNERPWFEANKDRYLHDVRDPMLRFIADLGPQLAKISKQFEANPKPVGGSMMRIYRDVRFSKDKSPYKTAVAAHFSHRSSSEEMGVGFYMHLETGSSMVGGGVWRPEPGPLQKIRTAIAKDPKGWTAATSAKAVGKDVEFHGEQLKKAPRGFDEDHPCIEDIKRKDFALGVMLTDKDVTSDAMGNIVDGYKRMAPFMRFLCKALGLPF
jgi:uncharacterized protein (TIGR02453 family)